MSESLFLLIPPTYTVYALVCDLLIMNKDHINILRKAYIINWIAWDIRQDVKENHTVHRFWASNRKWYDVIIESNYLGEVYTSSIAINPRDINQAEIIDLQKERARREIANRIYEDLFK